MDLRKQALLMQTMMTKNLHLLRKRFSKTWRSMRLPKCSNQINQITCMLSLRLTTGKRMKMGKVELVHIMLSFKRKFKILTIFHIWIELKDHLMPTLMFLELQVIPPTILMKIP